MAIGESHSRPYRWISTTGLCLAVVRLGVPRGTADTLAQDPIARCQDLVRRQSNLPKFVPITWRVWDDPVPKKALPAAALEKIKTHDLLNDGGIGGVFRLKAINADLPAREVFAYCSYDNLFVWLQGIHDADVWRQFDPTGYILPH